MMMYAALCLRPGVGATMQQMTSSKMDKMRAAGRGLPQNDQHWVLPAPSTPSSCRKASPLPCKRVKTVCPWRTIRRILRGDNEFFP